MDTYGLKEAMLMMQQGIKMESSDYFGLTVFLDVYDSLCYENEDGFMKFTADLELLDSKWTKVMEKISLTDDEKCILRNVNNRMKYIAKDKSGELWMYTIEPFRASNRFISHEISIQLKLFPKLFKNITFENSPFKIAELLE